MMFGWVGLSTTKDFKLPSSVSFVLAFAAGLVTMALTAYLFKLVARLTSEGALYRIEDLVGKALVVYWPIDAIQIFSRPGTLSANAP